MENPDENAGGFRALKGKVVFEIYKYLCLSFINVSVKFSILK